MECVSQDGVAAPDEAARLESGGEKRKNHAVGCACGERWLRSSDGTEQRQLWTGAIALSPLRDLTLNLGNDGLRLGKPIQMLRRLTQVAARNKMKAAIATRSLYQLRGAGWRWRRRSYA